MSIVVDEEPLFEPSSNIKRDLDRVVTRELFNNGIFSGSQTYDDAPNPCLRIEGYGSFGLPLNERQIRDLEAFAAGGDSGVELGHSGGLTFPGDKVHIDNPQFDVYVKKTVGPALNAQVFGPKVKEFDVNYRLRSLTIRGSGSEFSLWGPEAILEDSEPRQYGTLSIILPSRHVGGRIHITHQEATRSFETASPSAARITAIAWYNGVSHNLEPVQSGYLACLCYELSPQLGIEDIPQLPQLDEAAAQLEHVFRSWEAKLRVPRLGNSTTLAPKFLICLLDRAYPDGQLATLALESSDELKVKQLEPWAKAYGFDLHLASVEYAEWWRRREKDPDDDSDYNSGFPFYDSGSPFYDSDESGYGSENESNHGYSSDDDNGPEVMLSFKSVKTLEGIPMQMTGQAIDSLHDKVFDRTSCFINSDNVDWNSCLVPDKYRDGLNSQTFRFAVLVISPQKSKYICFAFEDIKFACGKLEPLSQVPSSPKDKKILTVLLQWLKTQLSTADSTASATHREVIAFLRRCAECWHDVHLFRQVVRSCGAEHCIALMGVHDLAPLYQFFGWSELKGLYNQILSTTPSNALRVKFIECLLTTAKAKNDSNVTSWCQVQRELMLNSATTFRIADIKWMLELVEEKQNSDDFLYHVVIPRLQATQIFDVFFWDAFLSRLSEQSRHLSIIQNCLADMAERMSPWTTPPRPYSYKSVGKTAEQQAVDAIIRLLGLGIRFNCLDQCLRLLERMWEACPDTQAAMYYLLLVPEMDRLLPENSQTKEGETRLEIFFERAASRLMPSSATLPDEFRIFRIALIRSGEESIPCLSRFIDPKQDPERINDIAKNPDILKQLLDLVSHTLPCRLESAKAIEILRKIKQLCLAAEINAFRQSSLTKKRQAGNPGIELLRLCFDVDLRDEAGQALARFLTAPPSNNAAYIEQGLIPVLKDLPRFLSTHRSSLKHPPFSTFAAEVIKKYVRYVMRAKPCYTVPSAELAATGCGCHWCNKHLVPFMLNTEERLTATCSNHHVEARLAPTKKWGFTWRRHTHTGTTIYKPAEMVENAEWLMDQKKGRDVLRLLGDEEQQRQILGSDYQWVVGTIEGTTHPPRALPLSTRVNGVATKRSHSESMSTQQSKKPRLL